MSKKNILSKYGIIEEAFNFKSRSNNFYFENIQNLKLVPFNKTFVIKQPNNIIEKIIKLSSNIIWEFTELDMDNNIEKDSNLFEYASKFEGLKNDEKKLIPNFCQNIFDFYKKKSISRYETIFFYLFCIKIEKLIKIIDYYKNVNGKNNTNFYYYFVDDILNII